ncbi:MAG: oxidoreductase, partial [Sphingopyxis terrae]
LPAIACAKAMMLEAQAIAGRLGIVMPIEVERRIDGAAGIGEHKTSMLQDFERNRPIELDAIVGAVAELGRIVDVPCPMIDAIYGLTRQKAILAGLYAR